MFFVTALWWMFAKGEKDESVLALTGAVAVVEITVEISLIMALLGQ